MWDMDELQRRLRTPNHQLPMYQISSAYAGWNILGLVADRSACGYYRIINPLHMLKMHGANVHYDSQINLVDAMRYDVIVAPRQHNEEVHEILRAASWKGQLVIGEIDDDMDNIMPSSPAFPIYHQGTEELKNLNKIMRRCHGLTTTTVELGKWYLQNTQNVAIIDNYIDFSLRDWSCDVTWEGVKPTLHARPIPRPAKWDGKIVVGYQGGSTHEEDFDLIGYEINGLLEKHPNMIFALYTSPELVKKFMEKFKWPMDRIDLIEPRHFLDHPVGLQGIDIHLAPVKPTQFNLAKSALKIKESMAAGGACICSCIGPYARFHHENPNSVILVGKNQFSAPTFSAAISYLIDNPDILQGMKDQGRRLIMEKHSLEGNFHLWPKAWTEISQQVKRGIVGPPESPMPKKWYRSYGSVGRNDPCPINPEKKYKDSYYGCYGEI